MRVAPLNERLTIGTRDFAERGIQSRSAKQKGVMQIPTERTGITVVGIVIVDKINEISACSNTGELTQIRNIQNAAGGMKEETEIKAFCKQYARRKATQ